MDWARHEERAGQHHSHSPSLDTWRKAQERKTKKHLAPNCGVRAQKLARNQQTWRSFVAALRATRHNGHEMRSCSHNLFIVEYPRLPFQLRRNFLSCQCFRFCSNPKFQKIFVLVQWSYRSNQYAYVSKIGKAVWSCSALESHLVMYTNARIENLFLSI